MEITTMNIIQILVFSSIAFILGYQTGWIRSREKLKLISIRTVQGENYDET